MTITENAQTTPSWYSDQSSVPIQNWFSSHPISSETHYSALLAPRRSSFLFPSSLTPIAVFSILARPCYLFLGSWGWRGLASVLLAVRESPAAVGRFSPKRMRRCPKSRLSIVNRHELLSYSILIESSCHPFRASSIDEAGSLSWCVASWSFAPIYQWSAPSRSWMVWYQRETCSRASPNLNLSGTKSCWSDNSALPTSGNSFRPLCHLQIVGTSTVQFARRSYSSASHQPMARIQMNCWTSAGSALRYLELIHRLPWFQSHWLVRCPRTGRGTSISRRRECPSGPASDQAWRSGSTPSRSSPFSSHP